MSRRTLDVQYKRQRKGAPPYGTPAAVRVARALRGVKHRTRKLED